MAGKSNFYSESVIPGIVYKKLSKKELYENVALAKKGDNDAFNAILSHLHKYLCHLMKEFFVQGSEAQDIYQEDAGDY